ncbi:ABC transporter ATP-binding protein [Virgibacillus sp. AGTR]|uniref:ABC transporter ATP-binding protein n=1 Tax=unclassified Virgibacillus TaxID=2620237 RepID=UPI001965FCFB|nr:MULTISPECIES: ABC transporter ATP-binding protein [unclassified Virgibacillus]MCC2251520.1 ABC transporter ATP-binding protein [Virgibacillus sp. AGTR]MDY7045366.1 ABC transporter ATP-binding protein [Virgibacillus sp. M23]QRZ19966.1 ABC transporter ATP-binding protein [Virgibacillus sp. AGTR]
MTLLTITNLTKKFSNKLAVNNVNYTLTPQKCVALIGPNGAGKTTILRMLTGLLKPSSGVIQFANKPKNDDARSFIGYLPQYPVFYNWMTGMEFLTFSGQLEGLTKQESVKRATFLMEKIGIANTKNKRIGNYSGGMKQRLGIAQAIIHRPKLLVLDEPVSSLDPIGRREVLSLMEELKQQMTILFSTHILGDADEISDELLLLKEGEIIESGEMHVLRQKYQTAKISIQCHENLPIYRDKISTLSSVRNVYIERDTIQITAHNIQNARQEILQIASKEQWPLTNFTLHRASLEDMFMKVVNE